jgi:hypothetical protein
MIGGELVRVGNPDAAARFSYQENSRRCPESRRLDTILENRLDVQLYTNDLRTKSTIDLWSAHTR